VFWFGSFLVLVPVSFVLIFLPLVNLVSNLYSTCSLFLGFLMFLSVNVFFFFFYSV